MRGVLFAIPDEDLIRATGQKMAELVDRDT